jgi:exodeoxyribonuclease VII large subunit
MAQTYLDVPFKDKDQAKALGARWDSAAKKWYAPEGRELALFNAWLPAGQPLAQPVPSAKSAQVLAPTDPSRPPQPQQQPFSSEVSLPGRGIPLSQLLAGVARAVAQSFAAGVWTRVEVVQARTRGGHVYLELAERDAAGSVLAKADAMIWASTANTILPAFEKATGASLAPGIVLLVRARPVYKPQYGFNLEIDAIDSDYTLGDLEARKREIRTRLQQDGVFAANRSLPAPWDYRAVLVVAPQGAAGLGDFQAEAKRLERFGICRFVYAASRFQGEGAAAEILRELMSALESWRESGCESGSSGSAGPDAVVIIRGGGAVNDLAWLNDYALARALCELPIPVLTGIGHERDSTLLDEVANISFDTPSKVAAGIEQVIKKRVQEAKDSFGQIGAAARRSLNTARARSEAGQVTVRAGAARQLALARQQTQERVGAIRLRAAATIHEATVDSRQLIGEVRHDAHQQLAAARREVPALLAELRAEARAALKEARSLASLRFSAVTDRASVDSSRRRAAVDEGLRDIALFARRSLVDSADRSGALLREIAGQGPQKTLGRGFAIVRTADGQPITGATQAAPGQAIEIQFRDGRLGALITDQGTK